MKSVWHRQRHSEAYQEAIEICFQDPNASESAFGREPDSLALKKEAYQYPDSFFKRHFKDEAAICGLQASLSPRANEQIPLNPEHSARPRQEEETHDE